MAKHDIPGKPPAAQPHQPGSKASPAEDRAVSRKKPGRENLKEQGRQGNIHQNTRNQGYQQDR
ncbi:MAG: hypothetical protein E6Q98_26860 [Rhodospirillaceae bacterium]|nr:MAG: hypothetical protein E6Q98_26860 [Rhodospirillaceae bacterium]